MIRWIAIASIVLLVGCAQPRTVYVDRPVHVKVPVPLPCIDQADIPAPMIYPIERLRPGVETGALIEAMVSEIKQREKMEDALRAVLSVCATSQSRE